MIHTLSAPRFNELYPQLITLIRDQGEDASPRGTTTREIHPVMLQVEDPTQHILTAYGRPINVTFAMAEVIWILAGRKDVRFLEYFNSQIAQFSDDGVFFNAAYGDRLRHSFGFDQLADMERTLRDDPHSRQAVMSIWHPEYDRGWDHSPRGQGWYKRHTKDRACNLLAQGMIRNGELHWLQTQRSNDAVLGVPYNWCQFSHIQRVMADRLGVAVGKYTHVVNSMHIYLDTYYDGLESTAQVREFNLYHHLKAPRWHPVPANFFDMLATEMSNCIQQGDRFPASEHDHYWSSVGRLFAAHYMYRDGENVRALSKLAANQDVLGAAQARFYYAHRWHRYPDFEPRIREAYPEPVADWITAK